MQLSNKEKVTAFLKSFETGDPQPLKYINPDKYIQHNLRAADGLSGLKTLLSQLPPNVKVNTVRIFEDGDFVFAHTVYEFTSSKIGFDIFRFEDGKIVEHWDNLQATQPPNPSGHTMIDGATEIRDLDKTEINRTIVKNHVEDILNGRLAKLPDYYDNDNYIQHNPLVPDHFSGLVKTITEYAKQGITLVKYDKIHQVLGEGNFALVVSEGRFKGAHSAIYDLYRIENGKIAEHWDTIEEIPPIENHKNTNGKF
ncbi:MAG TPA: nuclear transport factor 2 family protein [Mucilaginibacter sp.]|jgi:predicted SnoaL-like aldol condensation-catalyzing enzyme|nr:nuclear transport factor 2 family protein [Mucilaginibacter sp.]